MGVRKSFNMAAVLLLLLAFVGCRDWRQLNGYRIIHNNDEKHFVVHENDQIVSPKITHWGTFSNYLMVYKIQEDEPVDKWLDRTGYFLIDTSDGQTTFAATIEEYKEVAVGQLGFPLTETELEPIYKNTNLNMYNIAR